MSVTKPPLLTTKTEESAKIAADVEAWLKKGNKIYQVQPEDTKAYRDLQARPKKQKPGMAPITIRKPS